MIKCKDWILKSCWWRNIQTCTYIIPLSCFFNLGLETTWLRVRNMEIDFYVIFLLHIEYNMVTRRRPSGPVWLFSIQHLIKAQCGPNQQADCFYWFLDTHLYVSLYSYTTGQNRNTQSKNRWTKRTPLCRHYLNTHWSNNVRYQPIF